MRRGRIFLIGGVFAAATVGFVAARFIGEQRSSGEVAAATPAGGGAASGGSIASQAQAAYKAGDYAKAVPLLKQWAKSLDMKTQGPEMGRALTLLADAESKLGGAGAAGASTQTAQGTPDPSGLKDPSTGKVRLMHSPPKDGEVTAIAIKDLANFEFDPTVDKDIPADVKAFSGKKVRLRGFMIPLTQADTVTDFALVPSLVSCCFGQPPGVQHTITCKTPAGKAVEYVIDEIWVEGTLKVDVKRDAGYTYSIFDLDVDSVKLVGQ